MQGNVQNLTIDLFQKPSETRCLCGGFGVWMFQQDLLDLEFLNFDLLQVVDSKPKG